MASAWTVPQAGTFTFITEVDPAIQTYLEDDLPTATAAWGTFWTTKGVTFRSDGHHREPYLDDSKSNFPLVNISTGADGLVIDRVETGAWAVHVTTRLDVWTLHTDPTTSLLQCQEIQAAIMSALQKAWDVPEDTGNFVSSFWNWDHANDSVQGLPVELHERGNLGALAVGRILFTWTHNGDA